MQYEAGEEINVSAIANPGWEFVNWTDADGIVSVEPGFIYIMPANNVTLTANFIEEEPVIFNCGDTVTFTYLGHQVTYGTISRGGRCWMDRNLGADPMPFVPAVDATGRTDTRLYGDLFQWGRLDDGHQDRLSTTTNTLSNTDAPGHNMFITTSSSLHDWRSPQNNNLWQGENGINNPCPEGWRLPTEAELNSELQRWGSGNSNGAYASTLKWPVDGYRFYDGALYNVGSFGAAWASSIIDNNVSRLTFYSNGANMSAANRAFGKSVRCILDN